jgi:hypothetical protein
MGVPWQLFLKVTAGHASISMTRTWPETSVFSAAWHEAVRVQFVYTDWLSATGHVQGDQTWRTGEMLKAVAEVDRASLVLSNTGGKCPRGYLAEVVVDTGEAGLTQASQPLHKGRAVYQPGHGPWINVQDMAWLSRRVVRGSGMSQ